MMVATLVRARVVERRIVMAAGVELVLHHPEAAAAVQPGQFFQLGVDAPGAVLRRPYSVSRFDPQAGTIAFLFSVVGAGSAWLAQREVGEAVDVLGPLGRGFVFEPPRQPRPRGKSRDPDNSSSPSGGGQRTVCVAGGLGIAVFPAVIERLLAIGREVIVLHGARTRARLLPAARLDGAEVRVATDDGSAGHAGPVTDLLPRAIDGDAELLMCGPTPMLKVVIRAAGALGLAAGQIQVALETPMGCGVGTCLGCAVPRAGGGYLLACTDGPCVRADRLDWDGLVDAFHG